MFKMITVNFRSEEEFEDTKGVIRSRKSKKDKQHNGQKKKDKRTNNTIQNTKNWDELRCSGKVNTSYFTNGARRVALVTNPVIIFVIQIFCNGLTKLWWRP